MNFPHMKSYEESAIDVVVNIINHAKSLAGQRMNLHELALSRGELLTNTIVSLENLEDPSILTCEQLLASTIVKTWKLSDIFAFTIRYLGSTIAEGARYLYYEVVFSQPTVVYPCPQAHASVFFRVEKIHLEPPDLMGAPKIFFRIEGQHTDQDIRYVALTADWILAVIKMKIKFFKRIESYKLF